MGVRSGVQHGQGKSGMPIRHPNIPKALRWTYKRGGQRKVWLEIINPGVISTQMTRKPRPFNDDGPVDREVCDLSPRRLRTSGQKSKKKILKAAS